MNHPVTTSASTTVVEMNYFDLRIVHRRPLFAPQPRPVAAVGGEAGHRCFLRFEMEAGRRSVRDGLILFRFDAARRIYQNAAGPHTTRSLFEQAALQADQVRQFGRPPTAA